MMALYIHLFSYIQFYQCMVYLVAGCIGGLEGIKQNINLLNIKYLYSIMTTEIQAIDFDTALKRIVQTSNSDSLLAKGIHEVSKSLESKDEKVKARYVILAKNCTEANYVKIIKGLAAQNKIPVYEIEAGETLGEWLGICKLDKNGNVTKKRKVSSVAIRDFSNDVKEEEKKIFLTKVQP